jgi:hypothetical protein
MDPEVHQEMEMGINQPKMKTISTLPSEASHLLNHNQIPRFQLAYLLAFKIKLHD